MSGMTWMTVNETPHPSNTEMSKRTDLLGDMVACVELQYDKGTYDHQCGFWLQSTWRSTGEKQTDMTRLSVLYFQGEGVKKRGEVFVHVHTIRSCTAGGVPQEIYQLLPNTSFPCAFICFFTFPYFSERIDKL